MSGGHGMLFPRGAYHDDEYRGNGSYYDDDDGVSADEANNAGSGRVTRDQTPLTTSNHDGSRVTRDQTPSTPSNHDGSYYASHDRRDTDDSDEDGTEFQNIEQLVAGTNKTKTTPQDKIKRLINEIEHIEQTIKEMQPSLIGLERDLDVEMKRRSGTDNEDMLQKINENIQSILTCQLHTKADYNRAMAGKNRKQKSVRGLRGINEAEYQADRTKKQREEKQRKTETNKTEMSENKTENERKRKDKADALRTMKAKVIKQEEGPKKESGNANKKTPADKRAKNNTERSVTELKARQACKKFEREPFVRSESDATDFIDSVRDTTETKSVSMRKIVDHANARNKLGGLQAFRELEQYNLTEQVKWRDFQVKIKRQKYMDKERIDSCFCKFPRDTKKTDAAINIMEARNEVDVKALKAMLENIFILEAQEIEQLHVYILGEIVNHKDQPIETSSNAIVSTAPKNLKILCRNLHQYRTDHVAWGTSEHMWFTAVIIAMAKLMWEMLLEVDFVTDLLVEVPTDKKIANSENCWFNGDFDAMVAATSKVTPNKRTPGKQKQNQTKKSKVHNDDGGGHSGGGAAHGGGHDGGGEAHGGGHHGGGAAHGGSHDGGGAAHGGGHGGGRGRGSQESEEDSE